MANRLESGVIQEGDDWPGLFLRGDTAFGYAVSPWMMPFTRLVSRLMPSCLPSPTSSLSWRLVASSWTFLSQTTGNFSNPYRISSITS